jgi:hypothetical protein
MKLPAVLQPTNTTAAKLAEARTALSVAEEGLAQFQGERIAALDRGDVAGARRLDLKIAEQTAACLTFSEHVTRLEAKHEQEQRDERAGAYLAAIDRLDKDLLPPRLHAVNDLAAGLRQVAAALGQLHQGTGTLFSTWPAGVPQGSYGSRFSFDARRAERLLKEAVAHLTCDWPIDSRLRQAEKDIAKFAATEAKYHAETIAELRALGPAELPELEPETEPEPTQEIEEEAA